MGLPGRQISLTISSVIWIECTNVTDRQTDVQLQTDTGPQQRPRLRIASRGKKKSTDFNNFWYTTYFRTHDDYHFVYTSPVKCCRVLVSAKSDFSTIFNVSPDYAQQVLKMTWLFDSRSSTLGSEMDWISAEHTSSISWSSTCRMQTRGLQAILWHNTVNDEY